MRTQPKWWLNTARNDLRSAELLLKNGDFANAAFLSQQAAEKVLKAYVLSRGATARTHSFIELIGLIKNRFSLPIAPDLETAARKVDLHYIQSGYPNGLGGEPGVYYDRPIASEAIECARKIFERFEKEMA